MTAKEILDDLEVILSADCNKCEAMNYIKTQLKTLAKYEDIVRMNREASKGSGNVVLLTNGSLKEQ